MMDSDRWKQIDEIFHAVLDREPSLRAAFLADACKEDDSLRAEVEALIAAHEIESSFFETPPADLAAELLKRGYEGKIANYQILKKIGSGGMGDVYLAEDMRLHRKVALKLLPSEFTKDKERILRFEREARAVTALNHPYILTVYDIGQVDSSTFIASEFIDGDTLRHKMQTSKIPLKEILTICIQVVEALDAAHRAGIIHRDIKPENIMIRKDGYVKLLDFGLAKSIESAHTSQASSVNTESLPNTKTGIILGTFRYMSPEQVRGLKLDVRTDIFSLGVVLYEMIAGRAPFEGATSQDMLVAVLEKNPPELRTFADVPDELQWIVTKTLVKDVEERYQTTKDLLTDLRRIKKQLELEEELKRSERSAKSAIESKTQKLTMKVIAAAVLLITVIATFKFISEKQNVSKMRVSLNQRKITFSGAVFFPEISPDGKFVAYCQSSNQVFVQSLTGGNPIRVSALGDSVLGIRWSSDGKQLLILTEIKDNLRAFAISPFGGQPRPIPEAGPVACWSQDAMRIAYAFYAEKRIRISSSKEPGKVSTTNIQLPSKFNWIHDIDWSASGRFVLLLQTDSQDLIATLREDGSQQEIVLAEPISTIDQVRWSWNSKSIYYWKSGKNQPSEFMKIEISPDSGKAIGTPKLILSDPASISGFSISRNGMLVINRAFHKSNIWALHLDDPTRWSQNQLTHGTWHAFSPSISPDGSTIAFSIRRENTSIFTIGNEPCSCL